LVLNIDRNATVEVVFFHNLAHPEPLPPSKVIDVVIRVEMRTEHECRPGNLAESGMRPRLVRKPGVQPSAEERCH
jgi:hypothetical protein